MNGKVTIVERWYKDEDGIFVQETYYRANGETVVLSVNRMRQLPFVMMDRKDAHAH